MPLHYVDPNKKRGVIYRANEWFSRTRFGQAYALGPGSRIDPWLFRATRGRYPWILGANATAPLRTTGARSGRPREVQVSYFHDGPDPILVASNGGRANHPHWYYNLRAQPQCELGDEKFLAVEVTDPGKRARLFALADRVYAGYADYRDQTAAIGRQIPIVRLKVR
ncbi:nitroreductase family deazaflavin-dependent oxidoreductase [Mycobacterium sp. Y57]|uniref:nitroreductase/quinone reductase family protein n=1 Tax=Mycolicibacterium xanthum TaxID=2796469 RepID=UPI001C853CD7|nr:nitroreductase/quinone reductase family protein [Mycolicibacterium xanthum]MBX7433466.1 nitroreductase family deazaflavin-dependent oxidoreductase [Mycolicibacterium xanthum]